ncbi:unnamed protein product [Kluyveromyces dobzhanskii CBS 2104]|uniref:Serine/threonine-protein kinase MEC1 n=1 Tax=Kluyveromyces dobzhanskii CBS 2104 TaxID=1427455 RepID=A0A0A8L324_9SACH|nr:unnamed protein product [Kluyveromyces dobzhanskii CBS 2104]
MNNPKVKYLEELILVLKSAESTGDGIALEPNSPLDEKNGKLLQTLLKNVQATNIGDVVFHKSFQALNLFLRYNQHLFSCNVKGVSMVEVVLNNMVNCSVAHYSNLQFLWLINKYMSSWLKTYSFTWNSTLHIWFTEQMDQYEKLLVTCLRGKMEKPMFHLLLKKIVIVNNWIIGDELIRNYSYRRWRSQFQRLMRLLTFVLKSTTEPNVDFSRIIQLSVRYISTSKESLSVFTFSLDLIQSLIKDHYQHIPPVFLAKTLLRIVYLCTQDDLKFSQFRNSFNMHQWVENHKDADLLFVRSINYVSLKLGFVESIEEFTFPNKQLHWLHQTIENSGSSSILNDQHCYINPTDLRCYYDKVKESLTIAKKDNDKSKFLHNIHSVRQLAIKETIANRELSITPQSVFKFSRNMRLSSSSLVPLQKSLAYPLLTKYILRNADFEELTETELTGIVLIMNEIFSTFEPPKLEDAELPQQSDERYSCLQVFEKAYNNRSRFLRLLSVRLLPNFTRPGSNYEDLNLKFLIKFLQRPKPPYVTETLQMSWVNLIVNCNGEYFDDLLLKLIDIFNSSDFAEHTMMSAQLRYLSEIQDKSPYQILSPILPILFKKMGKSLVEKKLGLQRIVQLVEYPAKTLLENFQRYVVPYALGQYKSDVVTEITRIMSDNDKSLIEEKKLKLLDRNSRQIFAVALVKHGFFSIETIETLFLNTAPKFKKNYITLYLPDYKTLAEVLKMSKPIMSLEDKITDTEKCVLSSLRFLLITNFSKDRRRGTRFKNIEDWNDELEDQFQQKMEQNVLGIFQVFSNDMHDSDGKTSYYEKLRVLNGISFMMKYTSKKSIISALAQLSICLQTGSEISEIQHNTLQCWHLLVKLLNEEQITAIIDDLFCLILQKWPHFSPSCRLECQAIFDTLVKDRQRLVLEGRPFLLLAFLNNPEFQVLERHPVVARKVLKVISTTNWLKVFKENLESNNRYVILQTLLELEKYFGTSLQRKHVDVITRHEDSVDLSSLLGALLDTTYKFRNRDLKICQITSSCISLIGLLDVTKHTLPRNTNLSEEICDFNNHSQTVNFLISIINEILVPSFWQSENPTKQLFVALVMQESLKYCGLSSVNWDINKPDEYPVEAKLWSRFNDISKTTLFPLLSSLYLAQSWKEYVPLIYPSFKLKDGYQVWIRNLTLDLLKVGTEEDHPLHVFSSLIREDDGTLSNFLLPFITMDIILRANKSNNYANIIENLSAEFQYIFNFELQQLNHFQIDSLKMAYNTIFRVYEYCKKWISTFKQDYQAANGTYMIQEEKVLQVLDRTEEFVNTIPSGTLAKKSLETDSFERSALYLEQSFRQQGISSLGSGNLLQFIQTTYAEIGDVDAVGGVLKMFSTGNLTTKIEELQYSKNWEMAQDCFEALGDFKHMDTSSTSSDLIKSSNMKMLKSMYSHQLYEELLMKVKVHLPETKGFLIDNDCELLNMGIEAVSHTGNIIELTRWIERVELLQMFSDPSLLLHYNIAKVLQAVNKNEPKKVERYINKCFTLIGAQFTIPSINTTLLKNRDILQKLHALTDIRLLSNANTQSEFLNVSKALDGRLSHVGSDFSPNHYILSIRKTVEIISKNQYLHSDISDVYFRLSQLDRKENRLDLAAEDLMNALKHNHHSAELEFAEILWKRGEKDMALKTVAEITKRFKEEQATASSENQDFKEVLLKYTEWLDLSNSSVSEQIIKQYNELIHLDRNWDAPYYSMGLYYSKLLEKKKVEGYVSDGSLEYRSIVNFLTSFEKGSSKIRQSLPKVVTLWLDTAKTDANNSASDKGSYSSRICSKIDSAVKNCGIHIWYTVLTQLLSRLIHPHTATIHTIVNILFHMTLEYPSVMLWYISILLNSESLERRSIGKQIIDAFQKKNPRTKLPGTAISLVQSLTRVCIKDAKNTTSRSGRSIDSDFKFNLELAPNDMCVPVNVNLKKLLPSTAMSMNSALFKSLMVSITKFSSQYMVFNSLKKPKKLTVIGSDGNIYGIMCKKEDVRQDNQYMQFANTMSFLLSKDVESRKRSLGITTYGVLSLREDCGLLEIVPNVVTLRSLFSMKYESMKIKYSLKSLQEKWQQIPSDQKLSFYKDCLNKFPPVLYQWFLDNFADPIKWYNARNGFVRSYSVMAMVGHILGLGDRHCENILLDVLTGRVLHVDFDCLFEKGKKLPVPEIVPFRLTQNIVDAFGIIGTEGTFKNSSEVTLRVMRNNEIGLVNIIETIMYDRKIDESIQNALKVLRDKIRGIDSRDGLALSVSGQVEALTQESTSVENLSKMYIGWLPFW